MMPLNKSINSLILQKERAAVLRLEAPVFQRDGSPSSCNGSLFSNVSFIPEPEQETIIRAGAETSKEFLLRKIRRRIANCQKGVYRKVKCPNCKQVLGDEKGEFGVRISCDNKFCACKFCIVSRKIKAKENLNAYKIKSPKMIHLIVGFEIQTGESKEQKQRREKALKEITKQLSAILKKSCGQELHALGVWDITDKTIEGHELVGKRFFMHYHLALMPVNFRELMLAVRNVQEKYKGFTTIRNEGYKPRKALFRYFVKILAGEVSGEGEHHTLLYNQFLKLEEYVSFFYKKKMLRAFACSLIANPSLGSDMYKGIGLSLPEKCPSCGFQMTPEKFWIIFSEVAEAQPPPDAKKYLIKQVYVTNRCFTEVKTPL